MNLMRGDRPKMPKKKALYNKKTWKYLMSSKYRDSLDALFGKEKRSKFND